MNVMIVSDTLELSKAIAKYLETALKFQCMYFEYDNLKVLSKEIFDKIEIFIFELFKYNKETEELRAQGVINAETYKSSNKKILIFSGDILGEEIKSPIYWDMGSRESFKEKILNLLKIENIDYEKEIKKLKEIFKEFITKPKHH